MQVFDDIGEPMVGLSSGYTSTLERETVRSCGEGKAGFSVTPMRGMQMV